LDFPTRLPFLLELEATFLQWDLQKPVFSLLNFNRSAGASFEGFELKPFVSFPFNPTTKTTVGHAFQNLTWSYFDKAAVVSTDTLDRTRFFGSSTFVALENNGLDEKMYPGRGKALYLSLRLNRGREEYVPGPFPDRRRSADRVWFMARASYQSYVRAFNKTAFGIQLDGAYSSLPPQATLTGNTLAAPLFQPLQESPVVFIPRLYSKMFVAGGLKFVYFLTKKIQFRTEWYYMHSFLHAGRGSDGKVGEIFRLSWDDRMVVGTFGLAYDTRIGPIAIFGNYYDQERFPLRPVVHVGYMLFPRTPWY
jgi:NTE family protein